VTVYLGLDDLLFIAEQLLGKPAAVRDAGLLSSAEARPATDVFGQEVYQDIWSKAAALLQSIALNHALVDGNKRLAWAAAQVFLALNGTPVVAVDVDAAEAFVLAVVTHELEDVSEIARGLVRLYGA
jgi:death-on-curing protein